MFTTPCFIRKNTPELRKKLEELGYRLDMSIDKMMDSNILFTTATSVYAVYEDMETIDESDGFIDCGTNENLFLALAALRDDSDYMQRFTDGIYWFMVDIPDTDFSSWLYNEWDGDCGKDEIDSFHKATPEELINHFKDEGK